MRVNAVIVAAGEGKRMGGELPKPFLLLGGHPLILRTLSCFAASRTVRKVILVTAKKDLSKCQSMVRSDPQLSALQFVFQSGGLRRQDSVNEGLTRLDADCEIVVIHDGVRPFVSPNLIDQCVDVGLKEGAVVVGVPVRDTIKLMTQDRRVASTPPRDSLWEIHTPQVFRAELIREAHHRAALEGLEATDDAVLVEHLGTSVTVLEGHRTNIKITVPDDLLFAEALIREGKVPQKVKRGSAKTRN